MVAVTTSYIDRDVLKQILFLTETDEWDEYLDLLIRSVADAIDQHTGRTFLTTGLEETRYFRGRGGRHLEVDDTYSVTSLKMDTNGDGTFDETLTEGDDFDLHPLNEGAKTRVVLRSESSLGAFPHGSKAIEVVGLWGWETVPGSVEQAAMLTATRWFKRKETDYKEASEAGATRLLDPDVLVILEPYRRRRDRVLGSV